MSDTITLTGVVATIPRVTTISGGIALTSFRLASNQRRYDRNTSKWVDGDTNWYTVSAFRQLGANAGISIHKGERVIVSGRMRVRDWTNGDRTGTSVDIEADSLGHDLSWGTTAFARNSSTAESSEPSGRSATEDFPSEGGAVTAPAFGSDTDTDTDTNNAGDYGSDGYGRAGQNGNIEREAEDETGDMTAGHATVGDAGVTVPAAAGQAEESDPTPF